MPSVSRSKKSWADDRFSKLLRPPVPAEIRGAPGFVKPGDPRYDHPRGWGEETSSAPDVDTAGAKPAAVQPHEDDTRTARRRAVEATLRRVDEAMRKLRG
jgi:hypothetical protein